MQIKPQAQPEFEDWRGWFMDVSVPYSRGEHNLESFPRIRSDVLIFWNGVRVKNVFAFDLTAGDKWRSLLSCSRGTREGPHENKCPSTGIVASSVVGFDFDRTKRGKLENGTNDFHGASGLGNHSHSIDRLEPPVPGDPAGRGFIWPAFP